MSGGTFPDGTAVTEVRDLKYALPDHYDNLAGALVETMRIYSLGRTKVR